LQIREQGVDRLLGKDGSMPAGVGRWRRRHAPSKREVRGGIGEAIGE
jgi:hypothetical protein